MTIEEVKRCKGKCKEIKPLSEFHKQSKSKDGRRARCGECTNEAKLSRKKPVDPIEEKKVYKPQRRIKPDCMKAWWV